jgi:hypothetical protein
VIERRPVGAWEPVGYQPTDHELQEYEKESMAQHIGWRYGKPEAEMTGSGPFGF